MTRKKKGTWGYNKDMRAEVNMKKRAFQEYMYTQKSVIEKGVGDNFDNNLTAFIKEDNQTESPKNDLNKIIKTERQRKIDYEFGINTVHINWTQRRIWRKNNYRRIGHCEEGNGPIILEELEEEMKKLKNEGSNIDTKMAKYIGANEK